MLTETATAPNPTDASASTEASATQTAPAASGTGETQQTQTAETRAATATETQATGTQKTETSPAGAPEKYTFTAPKGAEYDAGILDAFTGAAKEANLAQDAAQKLIDKMAPAIAARQDDQIKAVHQGWQEASNADKEFGGDKLKENLGVARKALDNFGTPELRTLLEETGMGNHPEVIRLLYRAGKAISEDKFVGGNTGGKAGVDATNVLYPTMKKE